MPIKIPLVLQYIDEAGKDRPKDMIVLMSDPVNTERGSYRENNYRYSCNFTLKIPDHIWNYLAGKTVPMKHATTNAPPRTYGSTIQSFSKTLSKHSLQDVIKDWESLLHDYRWLRDIDKAGLDKVIFYRFDNHAGDYTDEWNSDIKYGIGARLYFSFIIGYRTRAGKDGRQDKSDIRYTADKSFINGYSNKIIYEMKFVKWSEDRERFFHSLHQNFMALIGRIDEFEKGLTESKINQLMAMASQSKLLGAGSE